MKAPPGSVVFLPRGIPHQFRNAGTTPASFWGVAVPSGFEHFFEGASGIFAQDGPPDFAAIVNLASEHGIALVGPPPGAH
jgi:hypothetical protein